MSWSDCTKNSASRMPPDAELQIALRVVGELDARARSTSCAISLAIRGSIALRQTNGASASRTRAPKREIAGDGPRAQERRALPRPTPRLVVALGRGERVDERTARSLGAEAQIDAPDEAVVGDLLERRGEALRDAREVLVERLFDDDAVFCTSPSSVS